MREILKNMLRRKTRTLLTVGGIAIGIFAFTVMGSMAEKINLLVSGGTKYYADKVTIEGSNSTFISVPMDISKASELVKVDGVAYVAPSVYSMLDDLGTVSFGPPPAVVGIDLNARQYESFRLSMSAGRTLEAGDVNKVTVGSDLVKKLSAKVGQNITIKGRQYEVVGIMEKTLTAPDNEVFTTLADAQIIYHDSLPELIKNQVSVGSVVNGFVVYPTKGTNPDSLADKINQQISGIKANGPKAFQEQIASATGIFNSILFGIAAISLLVGGLSIINTMTMSISERIREIGIKKAVGAKTRNIMGEYLTEAGVIGLFGGVIGWVLGAVVVKVINAALENSGTPIFLLTWRISVFAVAFAVILGVIAGIYPAYYAVKINIVKALREE